MKNKYSILWVLFLLGMMNPVSGQSLPKPAKVIPLYEGVAPGSESWDWEERSIVSPSGLPITQNVVKPVLMYYPPDPGTETGTAMVIAPGGGFRNLMMSYEGVDIARYLNKLGVHAYVLKYRLMHQEANPVQKKADVRKLAAADGQQAVRIVRNGAKEMGIEANRIGMIGFSAGGRVTLETVMGPPDSRPDFAVPVYTAGRLKDGPPIKVPENAPPLCILTAANDEIIPWEESMELFASWKKAGALAELHIFQTGKHGFVEKGGGADNFMDRVQEWMKANEWLNLKQ